jgi:hypothetical protein
VPEKSHGLFGDVLDGPVSIVVTVRSGKDDDSKFHRLSPVLDVGFEVSLARPVLDGAAVDRCAQASK